MAILALGTLPAMVGTRSIASALRGVPGVRIVRDWSAYDSEAEFAESPPPAEDAEVVEGSELIAKPVAHEEVTGFTHFLDGTQKTKPAFWDGHLPASISHIAAAILEREDREMLPRKTISGRPRIFAFKGGAALEHLVGADYDVTWLDQPEGAGISALQLALTNAISVSRQQLEEQLAVEWLRENQSGWLLADGGIAQPSSAVANALRIVGVVKSHRKQYFMNPSAIKTVLGLRMGERTSVFIASTGSMERNRSYSWYLRLNESEYGSPTYGLIRVEMPVNKESIDWADRVSGWLLAERSPIAMPDPRYDRLLYPIRRVEMYLKSLQPSDAALRGIVGQ